MAKANKQRNKIIKISVIFWIVVFIFYAALFSPFIKEIASWANWLKTLILVLTIVLPLTGQGVIIYSELSKNKNN